MKIAPSKKLPSKKTAALARLVATLTFLATVPYLVTGCRPKPPAPPEVLAELKAAVENDGRPAPAADIFSMPGASGPAGDQVQVRAIDYEGSAGKLSRETKGVPTGTTLYYYGVKDRRSQADGPFRDEDRLFLVYQDATGCWRFAETKRPAYDQ